PAEPTSTRWYAACLVTWRGDNYMYRPSESGLVTQTSLSSTKGSGILIRMLPVPRVTATRTILSALALCLSAAGCAATGDATDLGLPGQNGRESLWPDGGAPVIGADPTATTDDDGSTGETGSSSSSSEAGSPTSSKDGGSSSANCGDWGECKF